MKLTENKQLSIKEYKVLFNTFYSSLCLFANKYMNDIELSKDVVQEVYIKIWQKKIAFHDEVTVKSYLYTAVKNKSLDYLKNKHYKVKSHLTIDDIKKLEMDSFFTKEIVIGEVSRTINNAVDTLPGRCKEIIRLNLKGFKNHQIAEELSISINTVKAQKSIAYKKLRPLLKDYYLLIAYIFFM